ncbi:MAG: fatty oxidation complex subunit alpha [Gemmatimonadetes bacterium]|nr:fatty oxidation complex subunit alpha [Gemmatimonadota bacterium]
MLNPSFEVDADKIGWITFDDPDRSLNVLTEPVMRRFGEAVDAARAAGREGRIGVVVIRSGKPDSFIAGADIDAIAGITDRADAETKIRLGQAIFNDVASLPIPSVAAIHGVCVGGGLELALACRYRVLSDSKKTGLQFPEVMLGILPAWGGTTRLPRLIGLQASLDMLLTGRRTDAAKARRMGLATEVVPDTLLAAKVRDFAIAVSRGHAPLPPKRGLSARVLESTPPGRKLVLSVARKKVLSSTGGHYPAPLRILDLLAAHAAGSVEASLAAEVSAAADLVVSPVCKNLVHVYYLREGAKKLPGVAADVTPKTVKSIGVLGAGVMGGGIAHLAADNGIRVYMKDIRHEAVTGGLQHARRTFDKLVERRRLSKREATQRMELIGGGLDFRGLASADVVVEAVVERMDVKRAVLRDTEAHVAADCVLATNTSSLSVDEMASALARPGRFCGMHFFNPVDRMPLVEVVRGASSTDIAVATVHALALRMGKVPVVVRDGPGFVVNRILGPYLNEAGYLLGDGASIERIDAAAKLFGMPMGPLRLIDEVGIDVSRHAGASLHAALGERLAPSPVLLALGNTKRLGRKGGAGFYLYEKGEEKGIDETVYADLASVVPPRREIPEQQIVNRLVLAMVNEAARVLEERIVTSASAVDLAMIMGTGFPPFRGGLLRWADSIGPKAVNYDLEELRQAHGDRFAPAPLVTELADTDGRFYRAFP